MKNPLTFAAPALCILFLCAGAARGGTLPLANPSFEDGEFTAGGFGYDIRGWSDFGTDQTRRTVVFTNSIQGTDGGKMLNLSQGWQVWQDAGVQYQPHTIYLLEAATVNVSGKTAAGNISRIVLSDSGEANHTWSDLNASTLPVDSLTTLKHRWNTEADPLFNGRQLRVKLESPGTGPSHYDVVRLKSCGTFTGGDAGEGLDLQGTFTHAVNAGSGAGAGGIGDANFRADSHPAVLFLDSPGEIDPWAELDFGTNTNDNRLAHVMRGIRHGGALGSKMTVRLTGLHSGWPYKLQLLFVEQSDDRGFDVKVDGQMVADDFRLLDYGPFGTPLCLTHVFTAAGDTVDVVLDAGNTIGIPHPNPLLSGLTVEQLEPWMMDANTAPPLEAKVYGHAGFQPSGGTLNSGAVRLTDNTGSQEGSLVVENMSADKPVNSFDVTFDVFCGQGGGAPADGYSFCWGTDLPAGTWGEEGTGNGLIVSFDTYVNPGETQREVVVKWRGVSLASVPFDAHNDAWTAVHIRLRPGGYLDVRHGVNLLCSGLKLPDFSAKIGPRWGWGARTGGLASRQWVDNVMINPFPLVVSQELDTAGGLRDAMSRTAARPGPDQIHFAPGLDGKQLILTGGFLATSGQTLLIEASMLPHGIEIGTENLFLSPAFLVNPGNLTLDSLTLSDSTGSKGGAIENAGEVHLSRCTLRSNRVDINSGGAMHNSGTVEAEFCIFADNFSNPSSSPAFFNAAGARAVFTNCTFTGNRAVFGGTAACITNLGVMSLTHCTVAANLINNSGGGILNDATGTMTLTNCVVAGNADSDLSNAGTLTFEGANLVQKYTTTGTQIGPAPISANPRLMTPGDHGGPVWTMPPHADSPVIDAAAVSATSLDARGLPRGRDGNADGIPASDLGAVERGPRIIVTSPADSGAGSLRSAIAAATAPDTMISFAPAMSDELIDLTSGSLWVVGSLWFTVDATALTRSVRITIHIPPLNQNILMVGSDSRAMFAGVQFQNGGNSFRNGGAVENYGAVFFTRCTFLNNFGGLGGAVYNTGRATLSQCTVSGNGAREFGGGIYNADHGVLRIHHCTISENNSFGQAGGVFNESPWSAVVSNSIIAGNTGANNAPADVSNTGSLAWEGANIVRAVTNTGTTAGPAPNNADPLLAPLDFSLGPMGVQATKFGSPARGLANDSIVSDQRGYPIAGLPDLGAYEAGTYYTYAIWRTELLPEPGSATGDEDKDGTNNYLEYVLNRNPNVRDQNLLPFVSGVPGNIKYTFRYQPGAKDFTYTVEASTNLSTWQSLLRFDPITGAFNNYSLSAAALLNPTAGTIEVRDTFQAGSKNFYRLRLMPR